MRDLELLAPARNADIGIAAIDCGADAVYVAGPKFGARQDASNSMGDIERLCRYAHRFGVRVFMTVNTILFDNELEEAERLLKEAEEAGADGIIAQDLSVISLSELPVHASTQCSVRTPDEARFYERLGCSRIILERQLSLEQIRAIRKAVSCELEFFVHGALCVCYSGQCYMSEHIIGRSANRGECIQACRSLYDLVDENGKILAKDKALLSMKDYNLRGRLEDLAEAGICSFKIEGRLKNISYVRNVTRAYSIALDNLVERFPDRYRRASFGHIRNGFVPDLDKTFNRDYTKLFLDGTRGEWSSMDAPTSMGKRIGTVSSIDIIPETPAHPVKEMKLTLRLDDPEEALNNGDGFSFLGSREPAGFRGDVCRGNSITGKYLEGIRVGTVLFRNLDSAFEKGLSGNLPTRLIPVAVDITVSDHNDEKHLEIRAASQDGRTVELERNAGSVTADNLQRMKAMFSAQIGKSSGIYLFEPRPISVKTLDGKLPFLSAQVLNGLRRDLAAELDRQPCRNLPLQKGSADKTPGKDLEGKTIDYKANVANHISREMYISRGAAGIEDAYEITHRKDAELMRTKYCIKYELGLCPVHQKAAPGSRLYLVNNGKRYALGFDCRSCEMTVSADVTQ